MRVRYSFSSRKTGTIEGTNLHKVPFPKLVREIIRTSDIILEILDARFIEKTRNLELEALIKSQNKNLIYILNKADLVDANEVRNKADILGIRPYVLFSCKTKMGRSELRTRIKIEVKKLHIQKEKGFKRAQVGIIGYPNTGKSSLINLLAGRSSAGVSAASGFTKGIQKIRLTSDIILLDTPGVVPEKEDFANTIDITKKHAEIGVQTYDRVKNPDFIVSTLMKEYPKVLEGYYKISADGDAEVLIEELGRRSNLLTKGNKVDIDRTARLILKDWQLGKIRIHKK